MYIYRVGLFITHLMPGSHLPCPTNDFRSRQGKISRQQRKIPNHRTSFQPPDSDLKIFERITYWPMICAGGPAEHWAGPSWVVGWSCMQPLDRDLFFRPLVLLLACTSYPQNPSYRSFPHAASSPDLAADEARVPLAASSCWFATSQWPLASSQHRHGHSHR